MKEGSLTAELTGDPESQGCACLQGSEGCPPWGSKHLTTGLLEQNSAALL